ncbi:MAG TPA: tRNA 4-thiouridine(8) synthase ThiI [Bdellovibrionales bacterium]|nr:MAG: tRNA 4-thiouridine(8) synthase ThiI [Bdellovibrionales bacterium GWB1_52_6]OFZ02625.1 MAG: tRNA 4-thiouridine(8) synthase ThiI [Bdellovibrionales bacterium GWA1_52_35]OFZ43909.1 MAG: tRNA 4-thiouridine(8) synthase ThiI [Bdellovibrionales bacterium GWC1_52_8]HAR41923.1 tRNA 4-thiouridine(8) synthase ThiI [Bdellovibrionales bacterium]HCM41487.1 tRNA 4-thiouridine(8) synthase ThiI [Bdellovibrionales bacterium]
MTEPHPAQDRAIMLRYHEVALKGDNRGWFEERLIQNTRKLLARALSSPERPSPYFRIAKEHGRIIVYEPWSTTVNTALSRVFGLTGISPIRIVKTDKQELLKAALEEFADYVAKNGLPKSFRVETRRSDKALPEKSMQLDHFIGGAIKDAHPALEVNLDHPEFTLGVEIRFHHSFLWVKKYKGAGGLPSGTNGLVLALMSGGLDSPVAAIRSLRRGCAVGFIHFYGTPFVGEESLAKVEDLVRLVNQYQPEPLPLHVVPFGKIQEKIALVTNPKIRTIIYRRMMVRIAEQLAKKIGASALVTGESIGQVASQTLDNLTTINSVAKIPILRPLTCQDKEEIIAEAQRWGTYETSIRPAADCCTLFADRHPSTRCTPGLAEEQEERLSVSELVLEALDTIGIRPTH